MNRIKELLKKWFDYPIYFYGFLGPKLFALAAIIVLVGVLDSLGLTMLLPLLKMADGQNTVTPDGFGNLDFIFDIIQATGLKLNLTVILSFLCTFFILKGGIVLLGNTYKIKVQQYFVRKIRINMLDSLSSIRFKKFITTNVGRIQNTMSGEVSRVSLSLSSYLLTMQNLVLVSVYIGFAILINPEFSIFVAIGGILVNLIFRAIYKFTKKASISLTAENHIYQGLLIQFVAVFKYLKATGVVKTIHEKLISQILRIEKNNIKLGILSSIASAIREPSMILIITMGIVIQTTIIGAPLSSIFISLIFFYRALSSLSVVQTKWNEFLSMSGSLANMRSFQAELDANQELKGELAFFEFKNSIEFRNAGFNYDTELILKEISLTINKNETVAFVGSSGSGKTTLVNLISGLMPVDSGEFLIDNKSAKNINMDTFHKRIGYITQEPIIFDATIFDNVTLWASPNAENKIRFRNAIEQSSIEIFINELPLGEDTELGNNGINLSGGQKQRISIAREIYKDIDILIMDEATSALDSETERNIQANIDKLRGKYTIIIVAHRLSTIKNADKIMVMKHGEIVSTGSYEELIEKEHSFRKMVDLQELG